MLLKTKKKMDCMSHIATSNKSSLLGNLVEAGPFTCKTIYDPKGKTVMREHKWAHMCEKH